MVSTVGFLRDIRSVFSSEELRSMMRSQSAQDRWHFYRTNQGAVVYHHAPGHTEWYEVLIDDPCKSVSFVRAHCNCPASQAGNTRLGHWCKHIWVAYICSTTEQNALHAAHAIRVMLKPRQVEQYPTFRMQYAPVVGLEETEDEEEG